MPVQPDQVKQIFLMQQRKMADIRYNLQFGTEQIQPEAV